MGGVDGRDQGEGARVQGRGRVLREGVATRAQGVGADWVQARVQLHEVEAVCRGDRRVLQRASPIPRLPEDPQGDPREGDERAATLSWGVPGTEPEVAVFRRLSRKWRFVRSLKK